MGCIVDTKFSAMWLSCSCWKKLWKRLSNRVTFNTKNRKITTSFYKNFKIWNFLPWNFLVYVERNNGRVVFRMTFHIKDQQITTSFHNNFSIINFIPLNLLDHTEKKMIKEAEYKDDLASMSWIPKLQPLITNVHDKLINL